MMPNESEFLTYKGRPLVRSGNVLYYGSTADPYVIMMKVLSANKVKKLKVSEKVEIALVKTDPTLSEKDRVVKKSEKNGLYNAMDLGAIWLERALSDKN